MNTLYKKALSMTLAALITTSAGFHCIPAKAAETSVQEYLSQIVFTDLNKAPNLPENVKIGEAEVPVTWDEISKEELSTGHRFWVNGKTETKDTVSMRVQVDAHKVLENFESSSASEDTVNGTLNWSGASQSSTPTPPTFEIENTIVHQGLNSLKAKFDFTACTSGGTLSTYVNPEHLTFPAGEVPNQIGVWIYGTDLNYYKLRLLGKSNGKTVQINSDTDLETVPLKKGWHFYTFSNLQQYQANELTVTTLPGLISFSSASGAKVPSEFYIDDIVAIYGNEIKSTSCLQKTIEIANNYCTSHADADKTELAGIQLAIRSAQKILANVASTQQDLYDAEDFIMNALESLRENASAPNIEKVVLEDFEGDSGISWEYATTNSSKGKIEEVTEAPYVHNGTKSCKLSYEFSGTAGTALAAVKGSSYPNPKLTFTGENTPQKIGMWVYGKNQAVMALRLDIRKADKTVTTNIPFTLENNKILEGWHYYEINLEQKGFTKDTGVLFNYVPSIVVTNEAAKTNSEIYVDDITLIYEDNTASGGLKKAALIGKIAKARALLIGAQEGEKGGQYPVGSLSSLRLAVAGAIEVLTSESQEQIDTTTTELSKIITEFERSLRPEVDLPTLLEKIEAAKELYQNSVEGEEPNQYVIGSKQKLQKAIDAAQAIYEDTNCTAEVVEKAKISIINAMEEFNKNKVGALNFKELDSAIASVEKLLALAQAGTKPGQYPQPAIDAFQSAKEKAITDKTTCKTQASVNKVLAELNKAQSIFDNAMVSFNYDKSKLAEAVTKAENLLKSIRPGKLGGQYPQADYDTYKQAVEHGKNMLNNIRATEKEITDELSALTSAMNTIHNKRIAAPWDAFNIPEKAPKNKREMRGVWLSTVINIDWPTNESLKIADDAQRIQTQKADLIKMLDDIKELGANTVFFQVRPTSDAFYQSKLAPWSIYLTGTYGKNPGFDPLQFAIDETHKRGMELHAWCNPYRVSMPATMYADEAGNKFTNLEQVKEMFTKQGKNVYAQHPDWIRVASSRLVLDPGIPEAIKYVQDCIMEIVNNYDVDGIHFDDYFYVGNNGGFDVDGADKETYEKYGKSQFANIDDWRRNNTYVLVKGIHDQITSKKPWVKFGVSPAGVWRNKEDDPLGSDTRAGIPNYDHARADTRKWVLEEAIDYLCPQVYWSFNLKAAPYGVVSGWWADLLKAHPNCKTELYTGVGLYRLDPSEYPTGSGDPYFDTFEVGAEEIERQLKFNMANPDIDGASLFTYGSVIAEGLNAPIARQKITNELWNTPALVPSKYWANLPKAAVPTISSAEANSSGVNLSWKHSDKNTRYYAIYRFGANETVNIDTSKNLIGRYYPSSNGTQYYFDTKGKVGDRYVITALNRVSEESKASNTQKAVKSSSPWIPTPKLDVPSIETMSGNAKIQSIDGKTFDPNTQFIVNKADIQKIKEHSQIPQNINLLEAYDMNLMLNGVNIQPNGKVLVSLKLPDELKDKKDLAIVSIDGKGNVTVIDSTVSDGYISFLTDHFSCYAIVQMLKPTHAITLDTKIYTLSQKNIYDIGIQFSDKAPENLRVYSSRNHIASVVKLTNGNYRVTGLKDGITFIVFEVGNTHASVKIIVQNGAKPHGDSTRVKLLY